MIYTLEKFKMTRSEAGKLGAIKSRLIQAKQKQERIDLYNKYPTLCFLCSDSIKYESRTNKFCSQKCSGTYNSTGVRRHGNEPSKCKMCNKKCASSLAIYCSQKCQQKFQSNEILNKWIENEESCYGFKKLPIPVRNYILKQSGYSCSKCEWREINIKTNKVPVQINHVDGNWANNTKANLEVLCPNCHSLTGNFGGLNRGNGRKYRYKAPIV
jgi:hypothetical protein